TLSMPMGLPSYRFSASAAMLAAVLPSEASGPWERSQRSSILPSCDSLASVRRRRGPGAVGLALFVQSSAVGAQQVASGDDADQPRRLLAVHHRESAHLVVHHVVRRLAERAVAVDHD